MMIGALYSGYKNSLHRTLCLLCFFLLLVVSAADAQSLGDPIVDITFGSGTPEWAGPLAADSGATTYNFLSSGFPKDGYYTIANTTNGLFRRWWNTNDHTGNAGGYMMIVNGSYEPGIFYTRTVGGLCGNTTYQFAAWVKNLLNIDGILPNVTFSIETTAGVVLVTGNTGDIQMGDTWNQYPFIFTTPPGTETVVIKMTNNAKGGIGNDLAIDDITFRPYGSPVATTFSSASVSQSLCTGVPNTVTVKVTSGLAPGYEEKLQAFIKGTWKDQGAASTATSFSFSSPRAAGTYLYRVVTGLAGNVTSAKCVVASNELTLTVKPSPTAAFSAVTGTCAGNSIEFTDKSEANGSTIASWHWDFGDGTTSAEQNPSHSYAKPGSYTVTLALPATAGCTISTATKTIGISALPVVKFTHSSPDCATSAVTFTDQSSATGAEITSRLWDYGDGTQETKTGNAPFQHSYASPGSFIAKLTVTNSTGCSSFLAQTITIGPSPVVDFTMPSICLSDASATFTDASTIADNTSSQFTYLWNFGDQNASASNPNTSTLKNPSHRYSRAAAYTITLKVTSANGCSASLSKSFMVNGSVPTAAFTVLNTNDLCSDRDVLFANQSTVDFGSITKIEMYYDSNNQPAVVETDNSPYSGKLYSHTYPVFHTPATANYQVKMLAYAGGSCVGEFSKTITLKAAPQLSFPAVPPVCQNAGSFQLNAGEQSGIAGTGFYTGTGVSSTGLFSPATAGLGTYTISYIYTANGSCTDTVSQQVTVEPLPTVTVENDLTVLQDGSAKIEATATGADLTYQWSPTVGLSSATVLNPIVTPTTDITYTLIVTSAGGCQASGSIKISVLQRPLVPNTFTPNSDGINDTWNIKYMDLYPDCTVQIFNRYGQKLYSSIGYPTPWDGRCNGSVVPSGVYYYVIDPKRGLSQIAGWVAVVK